MSINQMGSFSSGFTQTSSGIERASERISSGSRINSSADDAAGLAITNRFSSQINAFSQSIRNANNGISFLQSAESGFSSITENLHRLRELSVQSANGTLNDSDRKFLNKESQQLKDDISRTIEDSTFNNKNLYASGDSIGIQVGSDASDSIEVGIDNFSDALTNIHFSTVDLSTAEGATAALTIVDELQTQVDNASAGIGASINRLDSNMTNLYSREENTVAARSQIEDADMAKEISALIANRLRQNVSISLHAQANASASDVLRLLDSQ
ncbi:MAG: flagellin [Candidatus Endobugula sp.]|jgi:flagellin